MFTRNFRKFRLSASGLLLLGAVYACANVGLQGVAVWAESRAGAYPYWAGENPLRYLVPALHSHAAKPRLFLMGASTGEEGLVCEDFQAAFPQHAVFQASMSTGTLDDVLLALDYLQREYGTDSLPRVLVLGLDVRMVGNFPRHFGAQGDATRYAPFLDALRDYAPRYGTRPTQWGSELCPKSFLEGTASRLQFWLTKQQPRYRAGLAKLLDVRINGRSGGQLDVPPLPAADIGDEGAWLRRPLHVLSLMAWREYVPEVGAWNALRRWSREFASPYDIKYRPQQSSELVAEYAEHVAAHYWDNVFHWDPESEADLVRRQLQTLHEFIRAQGISLYVVNMPVHRVYRDSQPPEYAESYVRLVRACLPEAQWFDAHDHYGDADFNDSVHLTPTAAERLTRNVIEFMRQDGALAME